MFLLWTSEVLTVLLYNTSNRGNFVSQVLRLVSLEPLNKISRTHWKYTAD